MAQISLKSMRSVYSSWTFTVCVLLLLLALSQVQAIEQQIGNTEYIIKDVLEPTADVLPPSEDHTTPPETITPPVQIPAAAEPQAPVSPQPTTPQKAVITLDPPGKLWLIIFATIGVPVAIAAFLLLFMRCPNSV